jgi:hypothetical protein
MKYFLLYFIAFNFAFSFSKKVETPKPSEGQSSSSSSVIAKIDIDTLAAKSACAKVTWKDRGKAPIGYTKGMARAFFDMACTKGLVDKEFSSPLGASDKDALVYYKINPKTARDRRLATMTLLHGLGLRESTGRHCEGRDTTASNVTASTAEAGAFQTSYNSVTAHPSLKTLFSTYVDGKGPCFLEVFSEGVKCSPKDAVNYGAGSGKLFQEMAKTCPAFSAYYAGITLRYLRKHYGPINRKEVEYKLECQKMYEEIEALATPTNCPKL